MDERLHRDLLAAHDAGDNDALVRLYSDAADHCRDDPDAVGFFLTQAFVYALEAGLHEAEDLRAKLCALGRL